jgi:hypothetical protein
MAGTVWWRTKPLKPEVRKRTVYSLLAESKNREFDLLKLAINFECFLAINE